MSVWHDDPPFRGRAFVYVVGIRSGDDVVGPAKVGHSAQPADRVLDLQGACPYPLVLFRRVPFPSRRIARSFEFQFHRIHARQRLLGEWFNMDPTEAVMWLHLDYEDALIRGGWSPEAIKDLMEIAETCP